MPKFAYFDHTASQPAPVLGWYDTDAIEYADLPAEADMMDVGADAWADRFATPFVQSGALVAPPVPSDADLLAAAQTAQLARLSDACRAAILSGFTSSALGTVHSYPSNPTDQTNLAGSVLASLLPDLAAGWTTPFWCADSAGAWMFAEHTAAQIQQAGSDGKAMVVAAQTKLAGLNAEVAAASTVAAVQAIVW